MRPRSRTRGSSSAGTSHGIFALDEPVLAEIEEFVTGVRPASGAERVLRTMLFVDVVGSTERAARLGDAGWSHLLVAYRAAVRRDLAQSGGTEVDTAETASWRRSTGRAAPHGARRRSWRRSRG